MQKTMLSARLCRAAVWAVMGVLVLVSGLMPGLTRWYAAQRLLTADAKGAILLAYYPCALCSGAALLVLDRLLRNIIQGMVFVQENIRCIHRVRLLCAAVSLICLPAALYYPPLLLVTVVMAFLCLVVSVVGSLMAAALALREENDLTI